MSSAQYVSCVSASGMSLTANSTPCAASSWGYGGRMMSFALGECLGAQSMRSVECARGARNSERGTLSSARRTPKA